MNYGSILKADTANGTGFRVSLFVSGCTRDCKGCFNKKAQNPNYGKLFDESTKQKLFLELEKDYCRGLSILGGEPLSELSDNRKTIISLCKEVKENYPNKNIWLWSGYTIEEIEKSTEMKDILKYIDTLVDGPFVEEKKDLTIPFRGSSNQRIIKLNNVNN